jgi:hypothetical protein
MSTLSRSGVEIRRWGRPVLWAVLLTLCLVLPFANAEERAAADINCNVQQGPCVQMVGGRKVTLEITPRPVKAMQELTFKVSVEGAADSLKPPYIDLNMPAMDMGRNRVLLTHQGRGVFQGQGVIVRCRSGRRTWQAKTTFPGLGSASFIFDVVY